MNMHTPSTLAQSTPDQLLTTLHAQRSDFLAAGSASIAQRRDRIDRCIALLEQNVDVICELIDADFGGRHAATTLMVDIHSPIAALKYARKNLQKWMKPRRRKGLAPFNFFGARTQVRYQAKGVVGIAGTWNGPLFMLFAPLAGVLAAGNRAMLKPSDMSPRLSEWLAGAVAERFDPLELTVITGGVDVAQAFTKLPFDHLVFTGSTAVARQVMQDAAANLVPLTLELGGKSPVLIGRRADMDRAARQIAWGKQQNNGQICVAPDTIWLPREQVDAFVAAFRRHWTDMFPTISGNPDVTAIAHPRHLARVQSAIDAARTAGARIESAGHAEAEAADRRCAMQLVIDPPLDSVIAREEIFGPAIQLRSYDDIREAVASINADARPLALYYFGPDHSEAEYVLNHTLSGGACINEVMVHAGISDAPFGGIGNSGMGCYNGPEGFAEFSHARTVFHAGWWDPRRRLGLLPPYSDRVLKMLRRGM